MGDVWAQRAGTVVGIDFRRRRLDAVVCFASSERHTCLGFAGFASQQFGHQCVFLVVGSQPSLATHPEGNPDTNSDGSSGLTASTHSMSTDLTPVQRLAVSRALLADALRDPAWLILMRRLLSEKAQGKASPTSGPR